MKKHTVIALVLALCLALTAFACPAMAAEGDGVYIKLHYHRPDGDYTDYGYYDGLPMLDGFYHEVHYRHLPEQDESIRRTLAERGKTVYVTHDRSGGIIVENGVLRTLGKVDVYNP